MISIPQRVSTVMISRKQNRLERITELNPETKIIERNGLMFTEYLIRYYKPKIGIVIWDRGEDYFFSVCEFANNQDLESRIELCRRKITTLVDSIEDWQSYRFKP